MYNFTSTSASHPTVESLLDETSTVYNDNYSVHLTNLMTDKGPEFTNGTEKMSTLHATSPPSVVSSETERVFLHVYLVLIFMFIATANIVFLVTISRFERFHTPQYIILVSYASSDLLFNCLSFCMYTIMGVMGMDTPHLLCRILSVCIVTCFFIGIYTTGLVAWERYMYFCRPMIYERVVTVRNIVIIIVVSWMVCSIYCTLTEIFLGRPMHLSILMCQLEAVAIHTIIQIPVFIFPSLFMTVYSVYHIHRLASALRIAPAEAQVQNAGVNPSQLSMKTSIRMILLVSGAFWGTYVPAWLIRTFTFNTGTTWEDVDLRHNVPAAILIRFSSFVLTHSSSALNPCIYFYTHNDVWIGLKKLLGRKGEFKSQNSANSVTISTNQETS